MVVMALSVCAARAFAAAPVGPDALRQAVDAAIRPVMAEHNVPGMAVAITANGKHQVFNYGVASTATGQKVADDTLFEIGSISKTFTATLAAYAQARGALSFDDKAVKYLPALAGSAFDRISLVELGTYTAGGLPLQVPDEITGMPRMVDWFRHWRPAYDPGTRRRYSNPSIGLFGYLAAQSLHEPFDVVMERQIIPKLGLTHTWIHVPADRMGDYAWGYAKDGKPVRVSPGVFDAEAYGIKTTAADLIRFVELNMDGRPVADADLRRALAVTHTGYFQVGKMTQGLGWEMYDWPARLDDLRAGNDAPMILDAYPATRIEPPRPPRADVLVNKTGSTNGFGAYVAFVPARHIGIVMLANRNLPMPARVEAAWRVLQALDPAGAADAR